MALTVNACHKHNLPSLSYCITAPIYPPKLPLDHGKILLVAADCKLIKVPAILLTWMQQVIQQTGEKK